MVIHLVRVVNTAIYRLSYWFIELGILPVFSDPAHRTNGHMNVALDLKLLVPNHLHMI
jgi:hypothetical protein